MLVTLWMKDVLALPYVVSLAATRFRARHLALAAPARPTPEPPARPPDPSKASPHCRGLFFWISSTGWRSLRTYRLTQSVHLPEVTMFFQVIFLACAGLLPMVQPPTTATAAGAEQRHVP